MPSADSDSTSFGFHQPPCRFQARGGLLDIAAVVSQLGDESFDIHVAPMHSTWISAADPDCTVLVVSGFRTSHGRRSRVSSLAVGAALSRLACYLSLDKCQHFMKMRQRTLLANRHLETARPGEMHIHDSALDGINQGAASDAYQPPFRITTERLTAGNVSIQIPATIERRGRHISVAPPTVDWQ